MDERHPLRPTDVNGINKLAGEWYHIVYNNVYNLKTVSLRLTNTYGPRMRIKDARQTFLGWWLRQLIEGHTLQVFGDGTQVRDFNHVDDVVEALLLVAVSDAANGEIFNLGGKEPVNLIELAKLLIEVKGGGSYDIVPFPAERKRIDIGDFYGGFSKIQGMLGWQPQMGLRDGLAQTIAYYQKHLAHYI